LNIEKFLEKNLKNNSHEFANSELISFIENLSNFIKHQGKKIVDDSKFIVTDINDNNVSLTNIETNDQITTTDFSKEDLLNLNLGSNVVYKNNEFKISNENFEITNPKVKADLENMLFSINDEKDDTFLVKNIDNDKIYLSNTKEGGYFSIPREKYSDFEVGNLLNLENGKYKRQE
jgi:hypothetical protein